MNRLAVRLRRYTHAGSPPGRIDVLLVIALTFVLWFCIVPLSILSLRL